MKTIRQRVVTTSGAVMLVVGAGIASYAGVFGAGSKGVRPPNRMLTDPAFAACVSAGKPVCDPVAHATLVAEDPEAHPPSAHPHYINRAQAIAIAVSLAAPGHPANPEVHARMMTQPQYDALLGDGRDMLTNPHRLLWVVTVHAPKDVGMNGPKIVNVYTDVIDAERGVSFELCGCDVIKSG